MTPEVRELPLDRDGAGTETARGITTSHHLRFHSHEYLEARCRANTNEIAFSIIRPKGRSLEMTLRASGQVRIAVSVMSSDGPGLEVASTQHMLHLKIDGDALSCHVMSCEGEARSAGSDPQASFGVDMVELAAVA